jgi:ferric-dicitrate binding protein FerR (iron transport regulator)
MKPELTKDILFIYFSGSATALQKKMIQQWLGEASHVETYYEWQHEWEQYQPQFVPDTENALEKVSRQLARKESENLIAVSTVKSRFRNVWYWAAAVLIAAVSTYTAKDIIYYKTFETSYGQLKNLRLDDSSSVVLNANSTLKIPRWGFGRTTRHVFLTGEAAFSVKHTKNHQHFIVHTQDQSSITVLGTEFVVFTRDRGTRVVLSKGKVSLASRAKQNPVIMQPGDRATVGTDGKIQLEQLTKNQLAEQTAWKKHRFVFNDTPLKDVAQSIKDVFGVVVEINDKTLALRTATGSFQAENAEELLTNMSVMYSFVIDRSDEKIILIPNP